MSEIWYRLVGLVKAGRLTYEKASKIFQKVKWSIPGREVDELIELLEKEGIILSEVEKRWLRYGR